MGRTAGRRGSKWNRFGIVGCPGDDVLNRAKWGGGRRNDGDRLLLDRAHERDALQQVIRPSVHHARR